VDENEEINRTAAHCPNCGAEYRAGFDICADCGIALEPGPAPAAEDEPAEVRQDTDVWAEATRRAWSEDVAGDDHPEPAVVARLPLQEAMLLVGRLEEAGIPARVESDVTPYFVEALNVLKNVLIPKDRLDDATRVLADIETGRDRI
jgi:hypothetical protein